MRAMPTRLWPALAALMAAACSGQPTASTQQSLAGVRVPRGALPVLPARPAQADDPVRAGIAPLLDGFEASPSKEALLRHGDAGAVSAALGAIAQDPSQPTIRRLRAVSLLGYFPSDSTRVALQSALAGSDLMRREALNAWANAFGEEAVERLSQALGHDDPFTRIVAVKALGRIGSPGARSAIEARMMIETADPVRRAGADALKR